MQLRRVTWFFLILTMVFYHCGKNPTIATHLIADTNLTRYAGVWSATGIFMYSARLEINKDGTFSFFDRGCITKHYTEGNCYFSGSSAYLKSNESYHDIDNALERARNDSIENLQYPGIIKENWGKSLPSLLEADTIMTFFHNVELKLNGDTLYKMTLNKIDTKFIRKDLGKN